MASYEFPSSNSSTTEKTNATTINANNVIVNGKSADSSSSSSKESSSNSKREKERQKDREERKKRFADIFSSVKKGFQSFGQRISELGSSIKDSYSEISDHITDEVFGNGLLVQQFTKITKSLLNGLKKVFTGIFGKVWNWLTKKTTWWNKDKKKESDKGGVLGRFSQLFSMFGSGLKIGLIIAAIAGVTAVIYGLWDYIKPVLNAISDAISGIWNWFKETFTSKGAHQKGERQLQNLETLKEKGLITEESYNKQKKELEDKQRTRQINSQNWEDDEGYQLLKEAEKWQPGERGIDTVNRTEKIKEAQEKEYNELVAQFPNVAKQLLPDDLWTRDRNDDGIADYDPKRLAKLKTAIADGGQTEGYHWNEAALEELKNKAILKNTAGVSST